MILPLVTAGLDAPPQAMAAQAGLRHAEA